jgi:hypothetical protein
MAKFFRRFLIAFFIALFLAILVTGIYRAHHPPVYNLGAYVARTLSLV